MYSGKYNVISISTHYSDAQLIGADIMYSVGSNHKNLNFRVKFLSSDKFSGYSRNKEIESQINEFINSGKYNIKGINKIKLGQNLAAAEIYYLE